MNIIQLFRLARCYLRNWIFLWPHRRYFTPRFFPRPTPNKTRHLTGEVDLSSMAPQILPTVLKWLENPEPRWQEHALEYLQTIGPPAGSAATGIVVRMAQAQTDVDKRHLYIQTLNAMQSGPLVPIQFLLEMLEPETLKAMVSQRFFHRSDLCFDLAELLGSHGESVVPVILEFIHAAEFSTMPYYLRALRFAGGGKRISWDALNEMISSGETAIAVEAIKLVAQFGPEKQGYLTLLMLSSNTAVREAAAEALAETGYDVASIDHSGGRISLLARSMALVRIVRRETQNEPQTGVSAVPLAA